MHRLHFFKQMEKIQGVIDRQAVMVEIRNMLVLTDQVPVAFPYMPLGHSDIATRAMRQQREGGRGVLTTRGNGLARHMKAYLKTTRSSSSVIGPNVFLNVYLSPLGLSLLWLQLVVFQP